MLTRCAEGPRARLQLREAARPRTRNSKPARRRVCISGEKRAPPRLLTILDQKADLAVDAKHRDLIVLDNDFGILDPKRTNATQGLRCFANGLAAGVVEPVRRLSDNLDVPYDRHRPLLPLYADRGPYSAPIDSSTPELDRLRAQFAALMPYRTAAEVLGQVFPVDAGADPETLRRHTFKIAEAL